jgi:hypothetical protein
MSPALMEGVHIRGRKNQPVGDGQGVECVAGRVQRAGGTSQMYHVEGLPFRNARRHSDQVRVSGDGEYIFKVVPVNEGNMGQGNRPFGGVPGEKLEVTIDGARVHLFDWDKDMVGFAVRFGVPTPPIRVKAGLHKVGVTFSRDALHTEQPRP